MSIKVSIARTIKRLNLQSFIMKLPVFGQALYDGLAEEFDRVNDFRTLVNNSVVPNENMDVSTIQDNESKYGINEDSLATDEEKINRIIERAQRDGNGGPDWLEDEIQKAGFPLYVILNNSPQVDPAIVPGEIVASSPNGNIGGQFENFGNFQFGTTQFGVLVDGFAFPRPKPFNITADSNRWGYFFFLSPDPGGVVSILDLLSVSDESLNFLIKLVIQLKHVRNWCILQASSATIQDTITTDALTKLTSDDLTKVVISDL